MKRLVLGFLLSTLVILNSIPVFALDDSDISKWSKNIELNGKNWNYMFANRTVDEANKLTNSNNAEGMPQPEGTASDYKIFSSLSGGYKLMRVKGQGDYYYVSAWDSDAHCYEIWER